MLIYTQKPNAALVAGINRWRERFGHNVMEGGKGIKIIAPTPFKKKIEEEKRVPIRTCRSSPPTCRTMHRIMRSLWRLCGVPHRFPLRSFPIRDGSDGYFFLDKQKIVFQSTGLLSANCGKNIPPVIVFFSVHKKGKNHNVYILLIIRIYYDKIRFIIDYRKIGGALWNILHENWNGSF